MPPLRLLRNPRQITSHATPFKCLGAARLPPPICRYGICSDGGWHFIFLALRMAFKGPSHSKNFQHFLCQCDEPLKNRRRLSHTKRRPQEREQVHVHAQREADDATYIGRRRRQVYGIPGSGKQRHHLLEQFGQSSRTKRLFK